MSTKREVKKVGVGISPNGWISLPRSFIDEFGSVSELDLHIIRDAENKLQSLTLKRVKERKKEG